MLVRYFKIRTNVRFLAPLLAAAVAACSAFPVDTARNEDCPLTAIQVCERFADTLECHCVDRGRAVDSLPSFGDAAWPGALR